ncbi:putative nuclease HARBI1 [Macrobrachium nipponense]|uniref:putative nuclease HARBI1 n=1 Tax=Macrobrachium nipponense TaxID=159736 RepID=UPI0030C83EDE
MQLCNGDDLGLSQPSISRVISETLDALSTNDMLRRFVKFPREIRDIQRKQTEFMQIANMPGVVGVIDGTHIRIVAPKEFEAEYVNRKNFHSINVQLVFDAKYKIINIFANWPGSTHDARILQQSGLKTLFDRNILPPGCHLLGDSGYPGKRWLLTPYLQPQSNAQIVYNR